MSWELRSEINLKNSEKESEKFLIESNGKMYRLRNDFGNINIEFDNCSLQNLLEELKNITNLDLEEEIDKYMSHIPYEKIESELREPDIKFTQLELFNNKNEECK